FYLLFNLFYFDMYLFFFFFFFFQAEDGIRDGHVTGVQTCALPIWFVRESTNNPGAVKVTIRKFYRPSGSSTQLKGVVPDLVLPSLNNYAEVGEASLENPLSWDTIERSEERRVGKECRCRWWWFDEK